MQIVVVVVVGGCVIVVVAGGFVVALEQELNALGITFKHGKPYHPQTQGKVERFHKTLKKWLVGQPEVDSIAQLQRQVNRFVGLYNEWRPHQVHGCPPMRIYRQRDKAVLELNDQPIGVLPRVRRDDVHVVAEDRSVLRRFTLDPTVNYQRLEIGSVGSAVH